MKIKTWILNEHCRIKFLFILIDYESFNGYLNWFNQNENDIQNFSSNLPEIVNNLDDDDESFYSKHVGDYKLPPFPPLFDFLEDGKDGKNI